MAETPASTPSPSAPCCVAGSCCACPCPDRLAKLERTVCRLRFWLLVALGVLILLVGIAIGSGGARREGMRGDGPMRPMPQGPGPQGMGAPQHAPMSPSNGGPLHAPQGGQGPQPRARGDRGRDAGR